MRKQTVLLVDDEPDQLQLLEITLGRMQLKTLRAKNLAEARAQLAQQTPDLCLTDMRLPDGNGLTLIDFMQHQYPDIPIAMITAHGSVETAIEALKRGAFDFVTKPIALDKLRELVSTALQIHTPPETDQSRELIGTAPCIAELRGHIIKVARSQAPVHIYGESGVGKEVVARLIHALSPRALKPFIAINCGAIPPDLVESELFGHKKGAFTGATHDKSGLFQAAHGGTLLLDEVADLPKPVQVKLLRAIQEKAVRPVGSDKEIPVNVRLLSATHKNLAEEARQGLFRDDLYYRINVIGIHVPALRERKGDIPALAKHLLAQHATEDQQPVVHLAADAIRALQDYDFPGNIRELDNILARAAAMCEGNVIHATDLALGAIESGNPFLHALETPLNSIAAPRSTQYSTAQLDTASPPEDRARYASQGHLHPSAEQRLREVNGDLEGYLARIERSILEAALLQHRWNKTATAKALGISFRSFRYRLKKLGIEE